MKKLLKKILSPLKNNKKVLIVVDPFWNLEHEDFQRFPNLEWECRQFVEKKIANLLSKFENIVVATWGERPIHPLLESYDRFTDRSEFEKKFEDFELYYCGFHYGRCVLNMPMGVVAMKNQFYKCFVLHEYTMIFPADSLANVVKLTEDAGATIIYET